MNRNTLKSDTHALKECSVTLETDNTGVLWCFWEDIQTEYINVQVSVQGDLNCMIISVH